MTLFIENVSNSNLDADTDSEFDSESDSTFDSDSDLDSDSDVESIENNKTGLVLCELFHPAMHGFTNESDPNVLGHYLVIGAYPCDFSASFSMTQVINNFQRNIRELLQHPRFGVHPWIRNYKEIAVRNDYIRPEIATCVMLNGDEKVAIIKTFWVRLIQRTWKKVFQERCRKLALRRGFNALQFREMHGLWPDSCGVLPGLRGMLHGL